MAFSTDESVWDTFLAQWPLERLRDMSLDEYTHVGDKNCFTYWIEAGLDQYGSIWGGSAFKFAIYARNDTRPKLGDTSLAYDDRYGWYRRFGETPESAFEAIRHQVVTVAEAARAGQLEAIDGSELGPAYRWKIAFHYQNRRADHPIPCVFLRKPLLHFCGEQANNTVLPLSDLYRRAALKREAGESLMVFSRQIWRGWIESTPLRITMTEGAVRNGYIPINLASAPFPEAVRGGASDAEAGEPLAFRTDTGMAFNTDVRAPTSDSGRLRRRLNAYFQERNVQPGDVIEIKPDDEGIFVITHEPRSRRDIVPVAPALRPAAIAESPSEYVAMPVNKILYGPPGTGKTWSTVDAALEVLDPTFFAAHGADRVALKQRFDALAEAGLIRFVTFHQSFSYEDFVEGIRATTDEASGQLRYEVEDGVFKQVCEAARSRTVADSEAIELAGRRIWKLSLGDSNTEGHIHDDCIAQGHVLLGFGADMDFSGVASRAEIAERLRAAGETVEANDYATTALDLFVRRMKVGDLVVVTQGNLKFRAIGEVTGDYRRIDRDGADTYSQCRPVRWLRRYDPARPYTELMENRFSQMSIYELRPGAINLSRLEALLAPEPVGEHASDARVLIIDEINRGNVSRIFGELITLIEPGKREGTDEALWVTLPYSRERFGVPKNVHLIGTMNTADRSLAGLDVALRRRFEFVEMAPRPELLDGTVVDGIVIGELLRVMNQRIEAMLGRDYMLGHAYFMGIEASLSLDALANVFRRQVLPLLQEYFFEDWQKIAWVLNDHRKGDPALRFVQRAGVGVSELFGDDAKLPGDSQSWRINESAFTQPAAYQAIIKAP